MIDKNKLKKLLGRNLELGKPVLYFRNQNIDKLDGKYKQGIWYIDKLDLVASTVILHSKTSGTRFTTEAENLITVDNICALVSNIEDYITEVSLEVWFRDNIAKEIKTGKNKMKSNKIVDSNMDAGKVAAKITAGKALNKVVVSKIKGQLPIMVRGYAETPIGRVVVANIANFAVQNFACDNVKAHYAADAMMQAAMLDFVDQFNFEAILAEVLSGVKIPEVEEKGKEEIKD